MRTVNKPVVAASHTNGVSIDMNVANDDSATQLTRVISPAAILMLLASLCIAYCSKAATWASAERWTESGLKG